jgi:hypothetical protein
MRRRKMMLESLSKYILIQLNKNPATTATDYTFPRRDFFILSRKKLNSNATYSHPRARLQQNQPIAINLCSIKPTIWSKLLFYSIVKNMEIQLKWRKPSLKD